MRENFKSVLLIILLTVSCTTTSDKVELVETVSKVDHVLLEVKEPEALHSFLVDVLQLPVAWEYQEYVGFASGGVFAGNTNLESVYYTDNPDPSIVGFALEPNEPTYVLLDYLNGMNIKYPEPEYDTYWTLTYTDLLDLKMGVFYCDYKFNRGYTSVSRDLNSVGPLGIVNIDVINVETNGNLSNWNKVLYPSTLVENRYDMEDGPDISVVPGESDKITSIVFNVSDIKKCKEGLTELGMLGKTEGDIIYTNPENSMGLLFGFKEI